MGHAIVVSMVSCACDDEPIVPGLTCVCGDTGMQAMCELPQGGGIEVVAYVAFALIGAILLCSNAWCNGDESDEDEAPREMYS